MAERTVSGTVDTVKEEPHINIEFIEENTPAVLSTEVAARFGKKHRHVLDAIRDLIANLPKSFIGPNFRPNEYTDSIGRTLPCYLLSRDAFSLLAMGFTGRAAVKWKLRYVEAFNALEAAVREHHAELARESGYQQGLDAARALPELQTLRDEARAEGARIMASLRAAQRKMLPRAVAYREKGLSITDVAKLLGASRREVSYLLKTARALSLLGERA